ncbi:hypothetical protein CSA_017845 [Cucumis sativus]|uniref:Uncharacterized protein n=1 Tax=Cucumis sativus TaxID=3659 RepID=A0ACB6HCB1_CUCSA|nr:hypothetical protein CSA_017845 [Cucumis sativus]
MWVWRLGVVKFREIASRFGGRRYDETAKWGFGFALVHLCWTILLYQCLCNCRSDLGNAGLSGKLVPQLGQLKSLQYLELYGNNISGEIPDDLGNLENLVSLDLYLNGLTGPIPDTDLSNNLLSGKVPNNGSFSLFTPISFANNLDLCGLVTGKPCPGILPFLHRRHLFHNQQFLPMVLSG